ncbi:hypothetical protein NQ318_019765 [Aromia moschata]|uniref:Mos1 transposase HTH domain-containing protein n=1 Tax=Aromia moschata TaxID=1265417 RepID=A0AAV8YJW8_9CUCU|nr:hypothetical protein NQ318_019765 [Aromia moschata]
MLSVQMEQRINLKFLVKLGKTFTEAYAMLKEVYGDERLSRTHIFEWFKRFKEGRETTEDYPRLGRPSTSKTDENIENICKLIREDRRLSIRGLAEINEECVRQNLHESFDMRKVCAKMVPMNEVTRFESVEAVKAKATEVLNQLTEADFQHCFQQWKSRMERCRDRQGEYIEGEKVATHKFIPPLQPPWPPNPNVPNQIPYAQPVRANPGYAQEPTKPQGNPSYPYGNPYGNPGNPSAQYQSQMNDAEPKMTPNSNETNPGNDYMHKPRASVVDTPLRRQSRATLGSIGPQSSKEYLEQYMRPPSRDTSVDRYTRVASRMNNTLSSRQPSVDRTGPAAAATLRPSETPDRTLRAPSAARGTTPAPATNGASARNGAVMTGSAVAGGRASTGGATRATPPPQAAAHSPPFEEIILKKRNLGQDIIPSPNQPKRTESLFIPGQPTPQAAKVSTHQVSTRAVGVVFFGVFELCGNV